MTNSVFVCKNCKARLPSVDAIFAIEMAANYWHDGRDFRQQSLRVTGCTLSEDMSTAITSCPNCGEVGVIADCYDLVPICRKCGNEATDGGFCSYNGGVYCNRCYKGFKSACEPCARNDTCELYEANLSVKTKMLRKNRSSESNDSEDGPRHRVEINMDPLRFLDIDDEDGFDPRDDAE